MKTLTNNNNNNNIVVYFFKKFSIYSDGTWKDSNTVTSNEYELMSILETVNSTSGDTLFSTPRLYGVGI